MKRIDKTCFAQHVRAAFRRSTRSAIGPAAQLRCAFLAFLLLPATAAGAEITQSASAAAGPATALMSAARVETLLDRLPLSFEANKGQFDKRVKFVARGQRKNLFLTEEGIFFALSNAGSSVPTMRLVRLDFEDVEGNAEFAGVDQLAGISNYFIGNDYRKYVTNVPHFAGVRQLDVYPGVDIVYYGNQGRLEFDFIVFPGQDVRRIKLRLTGHDAAAISESGDLLVTTRAGDLMLKKPRAYQEQDGERVEVSASYVLTQSQLQFEVGAYDHTRPLVIDPLVSYSTYLTGSSDDYANAIAVDSNGDTYVTGYTCSTNFPLFGGLQITLSAGTCNAFVTKLNANGTGVIYSTLLGGSKGGAAGFGIATDAAGNAYVTGTVNASGFPVTKSAYQPKFTSPSSFLSKLGPEGNTLVYSTFLNGTSAKAVAVDPSGNAYVTGSTVSGFTTTAGAFQQASGGNNDAFIIKLNAAGTAAVYATFLGGSDADNSLAIAVDATGSAYVTGTTKSTNFPIANALDPNPVADPVNSEKAFVTKLHSTGGALVYSTYFGGSVGAKGTAIAVDSFGNTYIAGNTTSADLPVLRAFQPTKLGADGFITKFDASGSALVYSSYFGTPRCTTPGSPCFGGSGELGITGMALDPAGNVYLAGWTTSIATYPAVDPIVVNSPTDSFQIPITAKIHEGLSTSIVYSTRIGILNQIGDVAANAIAVDANGNAYVAGRAWRQVPTTPGAFQTVDDGNGIFNGDDGFVFKVSPGRFTTSLSPSNPAPTTADSITLTALVTSAVPGGTVTFNHNGTPIGTAPMSQGYATFTTGLPGGVHELTAVYSGDGKVSRPLFLPVKQALICN